MRKRYNRWWGRSKPHEEGECSRARDVRAFPGTFDFLLSQPSPKQFFRPMIVPIKARLFPRYFCRKKVIHFAACQDERVNNVPNTYVKRCLKVSCEELCEGCESKKCKTAVCARVRKE